jgi:hypothetical protein
MTTDTQLTDTQLLALHDHWSRQLLTRIDVALELGADSPEASVAKAWRSLVRDRPDWHGAVVANADHPALRFARRSLLTSVAVAAGLATFDDPAAVSAEAGRRFLASLDEAGPDERRRSRVAVLLRRLWDGGPAPDPFPWAA